MEVAVYSHLSLVAIRKDTSFFFLVLLDVCSPSLPALFSTLHLPPCLRTTHFDCMLLLTLNTKALKFLVMDFDSLLCGIEQMHNENCAAVRSSHQQLTQAAELLNRQIQLLGGSPAWLVPLTRPQTAGDCHVFRAPPPARVEEKSREELQKMSTLEVAKYLRSLQKCIYPFTDATATAVSALQVVMEVFGADSPGFESMRECWGVLEASLVCAVEDREVTRGVFQAIQAVLQLGCQMGLCCQVELSSPTP